MKKVNVEDLVEDQLVWLDSNKKGDTFRFKKLSEGYPGFELVVCIGPDTYSYDSDGLIYLPEWADFYVE